MNISFSEDSLQELYEKGHTNDKKYRTLPTDVTKRFIKMKNRITPFEATHPGDLLRDELAERDMTQKELSVLTGIKPSVLSETINKKRPMSVNVAMALEAGLGIPAEIWLNLQNQYDIDQRDIAQREPAQENHTIIIPSADRGLLQQVVRQYGWSYAM